MAQNEIWFWHERARASAIAKLQRDLDLAQDLLKRMRYRRHYILELLEQVGQEKEGEKHFEESEKAWEAVEDYLVKHLEGLYRRNCEVLSQYDPQEHRRLASLAVMRISALTEFSRTYIRNPKEPTV